MTFASPRKKKRENLRDHMNDLKIIFSMLGETSTTEIARGRDAATESKIGTRLHCAPFPESLEHITLRLLLPQQLNDAVHSPASA